MTLTESLNMLRRLIAADPAHRREWEIHDLAIREVLRGEPRNPGPYTATEQPIYRRAREEAEVKLRCYGPV